MTTSDRLSAAAVGAVIGAIVGLALAWLVGIYSNTLGAAAGPVDFVAWAGSSALVFGLIGLLFGPAVGTMLGHVISAIFAFERLAMPAWLVFVLLLAGAVLGYLSFRR